MKLSEELKMLVKHSREEDEITLLRQYFIEKAMKGKEIVSMNKLQETYGTICKSGRIWDWCRDNDISLSGETKINGDINYSFWWQ